MGDLPRQGPGAQMRRSIKGLWRSARRLEDGAVSTQIGDHVVPAVTKADRCSAMRSAGGSGQRRTRRDRSSPSSAALVAQLSRKLFAAMTKADQCSGRTGGGRPSASRLATPAAQSAGTADSNDLTSGFTARSRSISALGSGTAALTFKRSSPAILTVPPAAARMAVDRTVDREGAHTSLSQDGAV